MQCIKCEKVLMGQGEIYGCNYELPDNAVIIETSGNFGSTFCDSLDGTDCVRFYVCDECLERAVENGIATQFDMPTDPSKEEEEKHLWEIIMQDL